MRGGEKISTNAISKILQNSFLMGGWGEICSAKKKQFYEEIKDQYIRLLSSRS
jgi:hypothetical protein